MCVLSSRTENADEWILALETLRALFPFAIHLNITNPCASSQGPFLPGRILRLFQGTLIHRCQPGGSFFAPPRFSFFFSSSSSSSSLQPCRYSPSGLFPRSFYSPFRPSLPVFLCFNNDFIQLYHSLMVLSALSRASSLLVPMQWS